MNFWYLGYFVVYFMCPPVQFTLVKLESPWRGPPLSHPGGNLQNIQTSSKDNAVPGEWLWDGQDKL